MKIQPKFVISTLTICILVRLIFFFAYQPWVPDVEKRTIFTEGTGDAIEYHNLAIMLLEKNQFAYDSQSPPEALRTPGYPIFIEAIYWFFGYYPWVVLLFHIVINTLACYLLINALTRLFNVHVAEIAGLFYALDPIVIMYNAVFYSETLFVFILIAAFWLFSITISTEPNQKRMYLLFALQGIVLGLATLVKPIAQYFPFILIINCLLIYRKRLGQALKYALVSFIMFEVTILPWIIRNIVTFKYAGLSTSGYNNLITITVTDMEMERRGEDARTVHNALFKEVDQLIIADYLDPKSINEFQRSEYYYKLALQYILNNPGGFGRAFIRGIVHLFINLETSGFARMLRLPIGHIDVKEYSSILGLIDEFLKIKGVTGIVIGAVVGIYLALSYLGAMIGIVVSFKLYNHLVLMYILLTLLYFIVMTGAAGLARFKLPMIPFYLAFTGIGYAWLLSVLQRKQYSSTVVDL